MALPLTTAIRRDSNSVVARHDSALLSPRLPSEVDILRETVTTRFGPVKSVIFYGKGDFDSLFFLQRDVY